MRVSRFIKQPPTPSEQEKVPTGRWAIWGVLALAVIVGVVLFFLYARRAPSIL